MVFDDDVGRSGSVRIREEVDSPGERYGKNSGAIAIERPVENIGARPGAEEEDDAPPSRCEFLQGFNLSWFELLDVHQPDAGKPLEVERGE